MKNRILLISSMVAIMASLGSCDTHEASEPGLLVPLTVTEDSSLPSIAVNGTQLHSETFGNPDNPMIVAIHGGPGADYRSMLRAQAFADDGFYVVFYDQRGSGLSQRHDRDVYTTQLFIDDLDAVINYYQERPDQMVILYGHSWGAMLATGYVNQYPDRIDGVILAEPGGFTWEVTEDYVNDVQTFKMFGETLNDFVYQDQFITGNDHNELDYKGMLSIAAADWAPDNRTGNAGPYPLWRDGYVVAEATFSYVEDNPFDFTTNLSRYTTEVLFTYSELNKAYPTEHAELVSSAYPNVQLVRINGTGHEIPWFGWENFYPVALDYLNRINDSNL